MRTTLLAFTALFSLGAVSAAAAHTIEAPGVEKGVLEAEATAERLSGGDADGESSTKLEVGYGFTDRLHMAVIGEIEDEPGESATLEALGVEAIVDTGRIEALGLDTGLYFEYEQPLHNEAGKVEGKLLLGRDFGPVRGIFNIVAEQPLTDKDGEGAMEFGYAGQATAEVAHDVGVGVMAFGDLGTNRDFGGRQGHFAGPLVEWELDQLGGHGELEFKAAYLFALGAAKDETDGQIHLAVEWEKEF